MGAVYSGYRQAGDLTGPRPAMRPRAGHTTGHWFPRRALRSGLVALLLAGACSSLNAQSLTGVRGFGQPADPAVVTVAAQCNLAPGARRGSLVVTATIKPGWHIYSITQPPGGPLATQIKIVPRAGLRVVGPFQATPTPDRKSEPAFGGLTVETHHGRVTWQAPIEVDGPIDPARLALDGTVRVQPCDAGHCMPPREIRFRALAGPPAVQPGQASTPVAVPATPPVPATASPPVPVAASPPVLVPAAASVSADPPDASAAVAPVYAPEVIGSGSSPSGGLMLAMGLGFLGGILLNLMPCVLPVIGLKILSFVEQAGHSRRRALVLNLWYVAGLLSVFVLLATLAAFLSLGWGQLFTYAGFNITLTAVVFVMGLSFLGVWVIPIPGFAGTSKVGTLSQQEGAAGAFFKGILTTILATPCSGPFLASALAWAVGQPPLNTYVVFLAVGLGMASPYLLVGAFPGLLRALPKPGAWMETFEEVMGFVLLGTVVYLLTLLPWAHVVPTVALLFGLWAACWWIGRTPLTAGTARRARAWLGAAAIAAVAYLAAFGYLAGVMQHRFARTLQAASPTDAAIQVDGARDGLAWRQFSPRALRDLTSARRTVLVDFTADWCMTCKTLEQLVLDTPPTRAAIARNRVALLQADWSHGAPEVTAMLERLGSKQVPVIALFPAGRAHRPIVLRGAYTQATLLAALAKAGPSQDNPAAWRDQPLRDQRR